MRSYFLSYHGAQVFRAAVCVVFVVLVHVHPVRRAHNRQAELEVPL
jgi:hypothetical protein